jgi:transposase
MNVVADAGYSNGEQAEACEAKGIVPHVPANRAVNNQGTALCSTARNLAISRRAIPSGVQLARRSPANSFRAKTAPCTTPVNRKSAEPAPSSHAARWGAQRFVSRHLHEAALQRMQQRATPEVMRLRRSTVEHPFATLKYRIFGHPWFLLRGLNGARTEMSLAVMVYNLKRMMKILGASQLRARLAAV